MIQIPIEKLDALMEDEKMAFAEYSKLGLPNLAKDEKKHYLFLKALKQKLYGGR